MAQYPLEGYKTLNGHCVNAPFIKHTPIANGGGLHGHAPTRPGCTTPQMGFLQPTPRDANAALLLTFGFANTW